jgi:hypothetical protein
MAIKPGRSYKAGLRLRLQDLGYAIGYMQAAFEDRGPDGFWSALRDVLEAHKAESLMPAPEVVDGKKATK